MAGLAFAASITQVIAFALHGTQELFSFVDDITNAPADVRVIKFDMQSLATTLHALESCVSSGIIREHGSEALRESLMSCAFNLGHLQRLLRRFTHKGEWRSAFTWRWSRDEIRRLRANISQSKQTLGLSLAIVHTHAIEAGNKGLCRTIELAIRPMQKELVTFYNRWLEWEKSSQKLFGKDCFMASKHMERPLKSTSSLQTFRLDSLPLGSHPWAKAKLNDTISFDTLKTTHYSFGVAELEGGDAIHMLESPDSAIHMLPGPEHQDRPIEKSLPQLPPRYPSKRHLHRSYMAEKMTA